jgi:hypothetical protein
MTLAVRRTFAFATVALLAACAGASSTPGFATVPPSTAAAPASGPTRMTGVQLNFKTLDDQPYTSFNRLLGINNNARIVGYYGRGKKSDPSIGYLVFPPYQPNNYRKILYPSATETIVTSLNDRRTVAGYYFDPFKKATFGFAYVKGLWFAYENPNARGATTKLLGLNDDGIAVGYYKSGAKMGSFEMPLATGKFETIGPPPGTGTGLVATAINGHEDVVGYLTSPSGATVGFVRKGDTGKFKTFSYPYATSTQFLGITVDDRIVGSYVDSSGDTHGLLLMHPFFEGITWQQIDDPNAKGTTVATGINLHDDIVGWYIDGHGTNHGFLATPK